MDLRQPNLFVNLCLDSDDQLSYPVKVLYLIRLVAHLTIFLQTPLARSQDFDLSLFLMSVEAVCQVGFLFFISNVEISLL